MGKQSRRVSRQARQAGPKSEPVTDFDLTRVRITDIVSVRLDSADNQVIVELALPVGGGVSVATYEETIDFDEMDVPGYLRDAARRMYEAAHRAVAERVFTARDVPCATCTGKCCGRAFSSVRLTQSDVQRLELAGVDIAEQLVVFDEVSFTGHVAEFDLVPWGDEGERACPNLTKDGCAIYEHRPEICREFSPWTCDIYDEDPDKAERKRKLEVMND